MGSSSAAAQVLDELVHQFADRASCFRELIQNAIDAGTAEVEINFEFQPAEGKDGKDAPGLIIAEIRDWGAGMDKEIIDERLTRLFSSAKEGDATKIGKFGIGFVSVFALNPAAICVDTGRGGEAWRVLFGKDRGFSTLSLDEAIEGTRVRLLIDGTQAEFETLRAEARASVEHWCQHVDIELHFDGERIDRPMQLDALVVAEEGAGARHIVVGHTPARADIHGFYNAGITLEAGPDRVPELAGLSFKVRAGDLEHTLTRDGVVRNAAFEDALATVLRIADGPLRDAVIHGVRAHLDRGAAKLAPWILALRFHLDRALALSRKLPDQLAACVVGRRASGPELTLGELATAGRKGALLVAAGDSPAARHLDAAGKPVLVVDPELECMLDLCRRLAKDSEVIDVDARWVLPRLVAPDEEPAGFEALRAAMSAMLAATGHKVSALRLASFSWPGSKIRARVGVTLDRLDRPEEVDEIGDLHTGLLRRKRPIVINGDHELVVEALELAQSEPELAAFMVLKATRLEAGPIGLGVDGPWSQICWERRCLRQPI